MFSSSRNFSAQNSKPISFYMECLILQFQKNRTRRLVLFLAAFFSVLVIVAFQNFILPSSPKPSLPGKDNVLGQPSSTSIFVGKESSLSKTSSNMDDDDDDDQQLGKSQELRSDEFVLEVRNGTVVKKIKDGYSKVEDADDDDLDLGEDESTDNYLGIPVERSSGVGKSSNSTSPTASPILPQSNASNGHTFSDKQRAWKSRNAFPMSNSTIAGSPEVEKKMDKMKKKQVLGVLSLSDMDSILADTRASSGSIIPRRRTKVDRQISYAKAQIENAPNVKNDDELYAPAFRNLSMFKRSNELMEQMLKVYVYKEGDRPIFHKPFLTGIYASEGWFMKQMEENKQYVTDDPTRAHLFYIPFSAKILQEELYVPNSHSFKPLIMHLRSYISLISSKYPFWNRTNGADHFIAGCHDWATHETGQSMATALRALCNANVQLGFEIGKDVSLPTTHVPNGNNPLENLGGKPAHRRTILAFFAGQMHGYLRPILVQHWENKEPDMVITGPMPNRINKKTVRKGKIVTTTVYPYRNYMKDSKYCICPRGYQVHSPRIVEAIFYGCVPVLISDNFVPPFFEVLDWSAFSVILPEKDVPRLKEVLMGIPRKRFMELERGVRGVRRHFLWNNSPLKYDLFHMILHNVWFNRIYQFK